MRASRAVITAAGRDQRHIPLQTVIDRRGMPRTVLSLLLDSGADTGLTDELGQDAYHHATQTTYFVQEDARQSLQPPADNVAVVKLLDAAHLADTIP